MSVGTPRQHGISETTENHLERAQDLVLGSRKISNAMSYETRGGDRGHLSAVQSVVLAVNLEHRLEAPEYLRPGLNLEARCDDTGTVCQSDPSGRRAPVARRLAYRFGTVPSVDLQFLQVCQSCPIRLNPCAALGDRRRVLRGPDLPPRSPTATATAASLVADTLTPNSRAAARLDTVRVMFMRGFSVVVCMAIVAACNTVYKHEGYAGRCMRIHACRIALNMFLHFYKTGIVPFTALLRTWTPKI